MQDFKVFELQKRIR